MPDASNIKRSQPTSIARQLFAVVSILLVDMLASAGLVPCVYSEPGTWSAAVSDLLVGATAGLLAAQVALLAVRFAFGPDWLVRGFFRALLLMYAILYSIDLGASLGQMICRMGRVGVSRPVEGLAPSLLTLVIFFVVLALVRTLTRIELWGPWDAPRRRQFHLSAMFECLLLASIILVLTQYAFAGDWDRWQYAWDWDEFRLVFIAVLVSLILAVPSYLIVEASGATRTIATLGVATIGISIPVCAVLMSSQRDWIQHARVGLSLFIVGVTFQVRAFCFLRGCMRGPAA